MIEIEISPMAIFSNRLIAISTNHIGLGSDKCVNHRVCSLDLDKQINIPSGMYYGY